MTIQTLQEAIDQRKAELRQAEAIEAKVIAALELRAAIVFRRWFSAKCGISLDGLDVLADLQGHTLYRITVAMNDAAGSYIEMRPAFCPDLGGHTFNGYDAEWRPVFDGNPGGTFSSFIDAVLWLEEQQQPIPAHMPAVDSNLTF